jgi:hypothetical protein
VYRVIMQDWFDIDCVGGGDSNSASAAGLDCAGAGSAVCTGSAGGEGGAGSALVRPHTHCAAIQDDFQWWHTVNNESEDSGKLLLVDTSAVSADSRDGAKERLIQVR